ncbi:MAG: S1 RNA-binding domain-containing protein, partial [Bacteroidota bacterium]
MTEETENNIIEEQTEQPTLQEQVEQAVEEKGADSSAPTEEKPQEGNLLKEDPLDDDDDSWWESGDDYTEAERKELEALYSSTLKEFHSNEIVQGSVVSIGEKEVVLNIGFKSEGIVPISEFRDISDTLKPGLEVEVFIENVEDQHGQLILSRKRAK